MSRPLVSCMLDKCSINELHANIQSFFLYSIKHLGTEIGKNT